MLTTSSGLILNQTFCGQVNKVAIEEALFGPFEESLVAGKTRSHRVLLSRWVDQATIEG